MVLVRSYDDNAGESDLATVMDLFAKYQRRLYSYIYSLVLDPAAAEEVLHETNVVVWKKFEKFEAHTDFRAWVFQIAYFEVRKFQDSRRRAGFSLSPELTEQLATAFHREEDQLEARREALAGCVQKLTAPDRQLVEQVYGEGTNVAELADKTGRDRTSIYRSLRRIRQLLHECVTRTLAVEGT